MTLIDLTGFAGVLLILIAYFLNLNNRLDANDLRYILMNLIGAILACLASVLMHYMPFVLLEGVWTVVSVIALIRYFTRKKPIGGTNLNDLIKNMQPSLEPGEFVFATVSDISSVPREVTLCEFKEEEGVTVILSKENAEKYSIDYEYIASWIALKVHSSLEAVGLTAAFSNALAKHKISCNVVAGYYHDHIFVDRKDGQKAVGVLNALKDEL